MKSTAIPESGTLKVTVTGSKVPPGKVGMTTSAFEACSKVSPWSGKPVSAISTVTEFRPAVMDVKAPRLPGNTSDTLREGTQPPGDPVGVGVGLGIGVEVGPGVGLGVGVCTGVGVADGTGVGVSVGVAEGVGVRVGVAVGEGTGPLDW